MNGRTIPRITWLIVNFFSISLVKRSEPSKTWAALTPLLAVILTMIAGGLLFMILGKDPFLALRVMFWDPIFGDMSFYFRPQLLVKAAPLILIALGLSIGFRAGIWNIGAEGQYIIGAICGASVALAFYPYESIFIFPLMILAGGLGGWVWAMIPALLRTKFNTNEILVSLMLVYVAEQILNTLAIGLLRNPEGNGFPGSRNLQDYASASNQEIWAGTGAHWGVVLALGFAVGFYILLNQHLLGFQTKLTGQSPRAAKFSGISPNFLIVICLGLSGMLAGLAGLFEVSGPSGQITIGFNVGYGFTAIIVAFLGRLNPIGIVLAGLLMALTYIGGELAQMQLALPAAAIQAFQGMLLFFLLALDVLSNYRFNFKFKKAS